MVYWKEKENLGESSVSVDERILDRTEGRIRDSNVRRWTSFDGTSKGEDIKTRIEDKKKYMEKSFTDKCTN